MKKKILAIALVVAMLGIALLSGTLAYFTDKDVEDNEFVIGDIDITLKESNGLREGDADYAENDDDDSNTNDAYDQWLKKQTLFPGAPIAKNVWVENAGDNEAYLRVKITVPQYLVAVWADDLVNAWTIASTTVNADKSTTYVVEYNTVLAKGEKTPICLEAITIDPYTDKQINGADIQTVNVVAEAIQTVGFADAAAAFVALDQQLLVNESALVEVASVDELKAAIDENKAIINIRLADGKYDIGQINIPAGKTVSIIGSKNAVVEGQLKVVGTLNLSGITVDDPNADVGTTSQYKKSAIALINSGDVVCDGVTFVQDFADSTAITAWWSTGDGANITVRNCVFNSNGNRPIRSDACVTVENCVFNDPYRYAVQMTSKSSTMAEDAPAYVNFSNNTINAGATTDKPVYGVQLEGGYGCSDLTINGEGNTIDLGTTGKTSAMYYCECGAVDHATITWNTEVAAVHENP